MGIKSIQQHCNVLYSCNTVWNLFLWPRRTCCQTIVCVCVRSTCCVAVLVSWTTSGDTREVCVSRNTHMAARLLSSTTTTGSYFLTVIKLNWMSVYVYVHLKRLLLAVKHIKHGRGLCDVTGRSSVWWLQLTNPKKWWAWWSWAGPNEARSLTASQRTSGWLTLSLIMI